MQSFMRRNLGINSVLSKQYRGVSGLIDGNLLEVSRRDYISIGGIVMNTIKRCNIGLFLSMILFVLASSIIVAHAEINKTIDDAVNWVLDFDDGDRYEFSCEWMTIGGVTYDCRWQCVDFVNGYTNYLTETYRTGNANNYNDGTLPDDDNYTLIKKYNGFVPRKGDILIWDNRDWGHVAIVTAVKSSTEIVYSDQNGATSGYYVQRICHGRTMNPSTNSYWGVIRPDLIDRHLPRKNVLSGVYVIHSARDDNMCLDISDNSTENNANIQLYHRVYDDVQKFRIIKGDDGWYWIQSIYNGRWLDVAHPIEDRANVKLYDTNTDPEDSWMFEEAGNGYVYIRNKTGYYLDIKYDIAEDNQNIQIFSFDEGNNSQRWRLEDVTDYYNLEDGVYTVSTARNTDYRLDISGNNTENRANIQLYIKENTPVQLFEFKNKGSYYVVRSVYAEKWLDIHLNEDGEVVKKANVQLWESNASDEEHWVLENAGDGYVYMRSNADYYLDVEYDQAVNNANIQVYYFVGNNSQRWLLTRADHKVSYDLNGGIGTIADQIKYTDINISLSSSRPTKAGYEFVTWNTQADGTGQNYNPGDLFTENADTVLYAIWKKYPDLPSLDVDDDIYRIYSALDDDYCLDITENSNENNANIQLYRQNGTDVQYFRFVKTTDGYYNIQSVFSGKWLDVTTPIQDGSNVKLYNTNTDDEDYWMIEDAGDGYVFIRNKTGYYLDVKGDRATNNANIQIYHFVSESNRAQKWKLERVVEIEPDFILPSSLTTIEAEAFVGAAFVYVRLEENVQSIASRAFADCQNLKHIYIPAKTASIAVDAFDGVPNGLVIHGAEASYGEYYARQKGFAFIAE